MEPLPVSLIALAIALIVSTVAIHSVGTFFLLWGTVKYQDRRSKQSRFLSLTWGVMIRVLALLLLHMMEVALWAVLFFKEGCFADLRTSLYFSLITYSTVGYGDVVLNVQYRMLGGIEALVGVLMLSWSTALLIGYLQRAYTPILDLWRGSRRDE
ncbi:MAG TPA: ion channel [Candidatus Eisenbacteria bacterium]|nr:ion channel [Candidatus Eisenbacteria bacterium]